MPAGRERAGEEAWALWRVHRLLGLSEVQVHPADHHGDQVPEVQRRGIRETRKHGEGWAWQVPRILRLLAIPGLRFYDALYANRGAVPEVRSTVRRRKEDKNRNGQRLHKRRMRLGKTGAGREAGGGAGRRGTGNGEGLGRSGRQIKRGLRSAESYASVRYPHQRPRVGSAPEAVRSDLRLAARKCVYNPLKRRK